MRGKALASVGIAGAIYVVALVLLLYAPLPSALKLGLTPLVGPTNFLFCSIDPRWGLFITWAVIAVVIGVAGALVRGAGLMAGSLAVIVWLGSGVYAVIFNAETC